MDSHSQGPPLYTASEHFAPPYTWVSRTGSTSDWCALQEALYKCRDTIQYNFPRIPKGTGNKQSSGLESLNLIGPRFNKSDYHRKELYRNKKLLLHRNWIDEIKCRAYSMCKWKL